MRGFLTVDGPGYQVSMPLSIIRGVADGPVVGVTGGVHGAEYPGIEAAIQLGRQLDPKDIRGAVIITSIVNTPAFFGRATYINPMDGLNLNRTYPGRPTGTISERMVWDHQKKVIEACDYYIDLHGGDMVEAILPFVLYFKSGRPEQDDMARRMANVYGLGRVLEGTVPGSGYAAAAAAGKPAIIAEAGGQGLVGQADVDHHLNGVKNVLGMLGVLPGGTAPKDVKLLPNLKMVWHSSNRQGIVKLNVGIGDTVKKGQVVGRLTDLWGEDLEEVVSQASGQILFIVSCLPINQGDALFAVLTEGNDRS
ncbi:MAG: succinylglutamate desuccinylase/aspartoacylase family protein [Bacillota bacterium]